MQLGFWASEKLDRSALARQRRILVGRRVLIRRVFATLHPIDLARYHELEILHLDTERPTIMSDSILNESVDIPGAAPLHPVSAKEFRNVVENRRSVRLYESTPIPEDVVRDCLDLTLLAPNSSNMQPWEFYWVRSAEKKAKLVEFCFSQNAAKTAAEIFVCVARIDKISKNRNKMLDFFRSAKNKTPKSAFDYYEKLVPFVYSSGPFSIFAVFKWLIYTIGGFFRVMPREPLGKGDLQLWAAKSTALACENLMLAFSAHGYDTCPMEGLDSKRVGKLLGLPRSAVIVMAISAGKRKPQGVFGARVRFEKSDFLFEV
jgi:nitroreductase